MHNKELQMLVTSGSLLAHLKSAVATPDVSLQVEVEGLLKLAVQQERVDILKWLLSDPHVVVSPFVTYQKGRNLLHIAAALNRRSVIRYLLDNEERAAKLVQGRCAEGLYPLELAMKYNRHEAV